MWERLRRFSVLDSEARGIFLRAAALLPVISVSLKIRGFRATQQSLQNFSFFSKAEKTFSKNVTDSERVGLVVRMVNAAARHGWGRPTCLERSLGLWWLLRGDGITSSVRIGARKAGAKLEAHAWVECEGAALNEPGGEHRHYATFDAAFPLQSSEIS
jgi:Transglutaminase-like superfamily